MPRSAGSRTIPSSAERNAASVLPEPVGRQQQRVLATGDGGPAELLGTRGPLERRLEPAGDLRRECRERVAWHPGHFTFARSTHLVTTAYLAPEDRPKGSRPECQDDEHMSIEVTTWLHRVGLPGRATDRPRGDRRRLPCPRRTPRPRRGPKGAGARARARPALSRSLPTRVARGRGARQPAHVPIYAAGETDGALFLAMRYVDGSDLGELVAGAGRLDPERALAILSQVAVGSA